MHFAKHGPSSDSSVFPAYLPISRYPHIHCPLHHPFIHSQHSSTMSFPPLSHLFTCPLPIHPSTPSIYFPIQPSTHPNTTNSLHLSIHPPSASLPTPSIIHPSIPAFIYPSTYSTHPSTLFFLSFVQPKMLRRTYKPPLSLFSVNQLMGAFVSFDQVACGFECLSPGAQPRVYSLAPYPAEPWVELHIARTLRICVAWSCAGWWESF